MQLLERILRTDADQERKTNMSGKVALINGGGIEIGAATAEELAKSGPKFVVVGHRPEPLQEVSETISWMGGVAVAPPTDIRDFSAMQNLANVTIERFGQVEHVVANA